MNDAAVKPPPADARNCPQCGTPLPAGALAGLCPACLLQQGAATDTATQGKRPPFQPPSVAQLAPLFPQLEILELIGKGGMGAVYKARQRQLDRIVALKILPPGIGDDPAFAERFAREAKALARLNHPGIVTLYEFGSSARDSAPAGFNPEKEKWEKGDEGQKASAGEVSSAPSPRFPSAENQRQLKAPPIYFFLMEFVDGVNLRQLLHTGRISPREALAIVPQICDALQFAHDQGIVHRDIKPENILLDRRGRVKVADLGLAKIVGTERGSVSRSSDENTGAAGQSESSTTRVSAAGHRPALQVLTDPGKVMGTPHYRAPEQVSHPADVDHRAAIYALGVVFYQMLTGELPGKRLEPPPSKVRIDVRLDEVVLRALEKKPEMRYQQVSALKTEVETVATDLQGGPQPVAPGPAPVPAGHSPKPAATPPTVKRALPYRRAAVVAALVWLLMFLASAVVTFLLPESFASTARIKVEREVTDMEGMAGSRRDMGYDPFFIQTEFEAIQSPAVLGQVIEQLDLNNLWSAKFGGGMKPKTPHPIQMLRSRMMLRPVRSSRLIELTVYSDDRTEAARIANAVAATYKATRNQQRVQVASSGIRALEARHKEQEAKIRNAQAELEGLRNALKVSDAEAKADGLVLLMNAETMSRVKAMGIESEARLLSLQAAVGKLKSLNKEALRRVLPRYRQEARLTEFLRQWNVAERAMMSVEKDFAPDPPNYKRIQGQIEKLKSAGPAQSALPDFTGAHGCGKNGLSALTSEPSNQPSSVPGDVFVTTHWTVVLAAGRRHTPQSDHALEELCRTYWFPLYAYVRRRGHSKEDAEDLTQTFFARFLEKNYLEGLSAERGRFRAFLLAALEHFLANEWDKSQRQKRGGGVAPLSLAWQTADTQFQIAATNEPSPEQAFDREWAVALLARVIERLRAECAAEDQDRLFEVLKPFLTVGKSAIPYPQAAAKLGISEGAGRTAGHRLRRRYREVLRDAIAQPLSDRANVAEEMQALFSAFSR